MSQWTTNLAGRFLVFDGPDGSGKSTQFTRFLELCRAEGLTVCPVREPGGTQIGERIRAVLLDPQTGHMSVACEMLLFMASRAQLVEEVIRPALERNELVLADRFVSSTHAYQGTAGGIDPALIREVGRVAIGRTWPDLTVVFDVNEHVAASRRGELPDRMEQRSAEFHRRVRAGFLEQARTNPDRYLVIDAGDDETSVFTSLVRALKERFSVIGDP